MSPEQGHGQSLDERSDLYSLGVIFYEMLMRQKPYRRPDADGCHLHARATRRSRCCPRRCAIISRC